MNTPYELGAFRARLTLGLTKYAAPMGVQTTTTSMGRNSSTPNKPFGWGLSGPAPAGFQRMDVTPGGAPPLQAAPPATPPTAPGPSARSAVPAANPVPATMSASGITPPLGKSDIPGADIGLGKAPAPTATKGAVGAVSAGAPGGSTGGAGAK